MMKRRFLQVTALACMLLLVICMAAGASAEEVAAKSLALRKSSLTMNVYASVKLTFSKLAPVNATLRWTSADENVATVSETGVVTARGAGRTIITVESTNGLKDTLSLLVKTIPVKSVTLASKTLAIHPGRTYQLTATVKPSNATNRALLWTSSDPTKVSVDENGVITARDYTVSPVVVACAATDGSGRKASCAVAVKDITVSSIKLKTKVTMYYGSALQLTAGVSPATAGDTSLTWTSSNPDVVKVDDKGLLTAASGGKAKITARANDGSGKSATCSVTVKVRSVSSVTLNDKVETVDEGDTFTLRAKVSPSNASFPEVAWSSKNPDIATVDENGNVRAVGGGMTYIVASADHGKKKATCKVRVRGEATKKLVISAVGDVVLGGDPRSAGDKNAYDPESKKRFEQLVAARGGIDSVLENVAPIFQSDDVTIINLECTLTTSKKFRTGKSHLLIGSTSYASALKRAGVEVASVANNHTIDAGDDGMEQTISVLKRTKVTPCGDFTGTFITRKGVRIGLIGQCTSNHNTTHLRNIIKKMDSRCDLLIVAIHWGDTKQFVYAAPTDDQKNYAHAAINAGADLVLGHHTHRPNGIELYKGKYIVYDLANFISQVRNPLSINPDPLDYDTFIFQQSYYVFDDGYFESAGIRVIPCATSTDPKVNNAQAAVYTGAADKARVYDKIQRYSNVDIPRE